MAGTKPYYTTNSLINSIKLRIMFPTSQSTLTYNDILTMINEELQINAVPAIRELHEEYFVYKSPPIPLVNGISRYPIPSRAQGMSVRDLNWSDSSGNFFKMSRIAPEEKSFFQQNVGSNQAIGKYYIEGNEVIITPQVSTGATGSLNFFIYLRPNYLVRDDRAATIKNFRKDIVISNNSLIKPGDQLTITTGVQTPAPTVHILTAVNSLAKTISSVSTDRIITTLNPHNIPVNKSVTITITGSSGLDPDLNNQKISVKSISSTEFKLPSTIEIIAAGSGGSYSIENQFEIGLTSEATAANLNTLINSLGNEEVTSTVFDSVVTVSYNDISSTFVENSGGVSIDNDHIYIHFNSLPTTYIDPETDVEEDLYSVNCLVDFLQTNPGHRTYTYDVKLRQILPDNVGKFKAEDLKTWVNNSSGGPKKYISLQVGDYICLANECIIPQIPPELHSKLAEMVAARILMAIGDKEGLAVSMNKLQEMDKQQASLIGQRIDSSVPKVFNQFSLLRLGKRGRRRI